MHPDLCKHDMLAVMSFSQVQVQDLCTRNIVANTIVYIWTQLWDTTDPLRRYSRPVVGT